MNKQKISTGTIAGLAILTAVVVVLQFLGGFIRFGVFSISLVLIPIVVGAALYGPLAGGWLGLVFSIVVLINDSAAFLAINPFGTVVTVLVKGTAAGFVAGLVYRALSKWAFIFKNLQTGKEGWEINLGVLLAAIAAPVVNTGIFLIGCVIFFLPTIREWGAAAGYENVGAYMLYGFVGGNFLFELLVNLILSPVIVQIIHIGKRAFRGR